MLCLLHFTSFNFIISVAPKTLPESDSRKASIPFCRQTDDDIVADQG